MTKTIFRLLNNYRVLLDRQSIEAGKNNEFELRDQYNLEIKIIEPVIKEYVSKF